MDKAENGQCSNSVALCPVVPSMCPVCGKLTQTQVWTCTALNALYTPPTHTQAHTHAYDSVPLQQRTIIKTIIIIIMSL